ncbi:MAG: hypothetical protein M3464_10905 [Chloroflexota bacterium]|nr:hypothetical protein [Chloroflexota bacterium]
MRRYSILSAIPAMALLFVGTVSARAQEDDESIRQLSPELCQVEPRAADELIAAFGLDAASIDEAPAIEPAAISIPLGVPAGPEVVAGITETTREFFACNNAGDTPRLTALLSEAGILRFYGFGPREPEVDQVLRERAAGTPEPREENTYIRLISVTDVSVLPDGRVAAFIVNNEPLLPPRGAETLLFIFSEGEDGWLIDNYFDFTIIPLDEGDDGTPVADGTPEADGTPATD